MHAVYYAVARVPRSLHRDSRRPCTHLGLASLPLFFFFFGSSLRPSPSISTSGRCRHRILRNVPFFVEVPVGLHPRRILRLVLLLILPTHGVHMLKEARLARAQPAAVAVVRWLALRLRRRRRAIGDLLRNRTACPLDIV